MEDLVIGKLNDKSALPWSLLLLADPSREVIEKYIQESDVYTVRKNDVTVGVYVLKNISRDRVELKNIAVDEKYQGQGIGKNLSWIR